MNRILILLASLFLLGSSASAAGLSSSYTYLQGKGKVNYKEFKDAGRGIVLHDFNGDGYTDVGWGPADIACLEMSVPKGRQLAESISFSMTARVV